MVTTVTEYPRYIKSVVFLTFVVIMLTVAVIVMGVSLWNQPTITVTSGEVVNVSSHAVVVETPDGRVNGLLASEERVKVGDLVTVTIIEDPHVIVVETSGKGR